MMAREMQKRDTNVGYMIPITVDGTTRKQLASIEALLTTLNHKGDQLMSAITDWAAKEQADLSGINDKLTAISSGVANLDAMITAFQNSPGTLSADDQAALDAIQAQSKTVLAAAGAIDTTAPGTPPTPVPESHRR